MPFTLVKKWIVFEKNRLLLLPKIHDDYTDKWWWFYDITMVWWYDDDIMMIFWYDDIKIWWYDDVIWHDDEDMMILGRVAEIKTIFFQHSINNWPFSHGFKEREQEPT